jgi:acyl-CoA synthetase (AMP-forming)/AMP-acid ligase II/acyl carrier protein
LTVVDGRVPATAPDRADGRFWRAGAGPDRTVLIDGARRIDGTQLHQMIEARADELGAGRLVLLAGPNGAEFVVTYLAALRVGSPVILTGPDPAPTSLIEAHDPDVVVSTGRASEDRSVVIEHRRSAPAHTLHPDLALLLSTSGSTGSPRLVRLSHDNLDANARSIASYLQLTPDDRAITSLPLHYCYGLSVLNSHLAAGASVTLTDLSVVDPCFWDLAAATDVTNLAGVPLTFELLERVGTDRLALPSLRFVTQAGGRMDPERVRRVALAGRAHGVDLFVMYGQTEATARMAYLPPDLAVDRPGSVGIPIPGGDVEIRPVDGDEAAAWPEDAGEIVYRGPNVMMGYAEGPGDLARGNELDELLTGDIGRRADDGVLEVLGRRSRFVKLCGLRLDLDRLEDLLRRDGLDALCVGDDEGVLVGTTAESGRVRAAAARHLGVPARLVEVVALGELPRSPSGKADRSGLTALLTDARGEVDEPSSIRPGSPPDPGPGQPAPAGMASSGVADVYRRVLGTDAVADGDTFVSAGGDSLSYVEAAMRLEELLGVLPRDWHLRTVAQLEAGRRPRRSWRAVETGVVLRAVAVVLVVGNHMDLYRIPGGAHVLLAVAGFNLARFGVDGWTGSSRWTDRLRPAARIAVPTAAWVLLTLVVAGDTSLDSVLLVNNYLGSPDLGDERWRYWFIEVLVQVLVVTALFLSVPAVRRWERRRPFLFPMVLLAPALVVRFGWIAFDDTPRYAFRTHHVIWVFLLGWAASRATTRTQRLVVTAVVLVACAGFFGDPWRDAVLAAGLVALTWIDRMPLPRTAARVVALVAAGSLWVYLTHYEVFPPLQRILPGPVALVATLGVGVGVGVGIAALGRGLRRGPGRRTGRRDQPSDPMADSSRSDSRPTARAPTA